MTVRRVFAGLLALIVILAFAALPSILIPSPTSAAPAAPEYTEEFLRWGWWYPTQSIEDVTGQLRISSGDQTWYYEAELYYDGDTVLEIGLWAYNASTEDFRIFVVHYDADEDYHEDYEFEVDWDKVNHHFWFKANLVDENTIRVTIYDCDDEETIFQEDITTEDDNYELDGACLSDEYWDSARDGTFRGEYHKADNYDWEDLTWYADAWCTGNAPSDCDHKDGVQYAISDDSCECASLMALATDKPLYTGNLPGEIPGKSSGHSIATRPTKPTKLDLANYVPPDVDVGCEPSNQGLARAADMNGISETNVWARMDSWNTTSDATPVPTATSVPPTATVPRPTPTAVPLTLNFDGYVDSWNANCIVQNISGAPAAMGWAYWGEDYSSAQCRAVVDNKHPDQLIGFLTSGSNWFTWDEVDLGKPQYGDGACCYGCILFGGFPPIEYCAYSYEVITRYP